MAQVTVPLVLFGLFSFILIASVFGVILHKNPIKSALFLIVFFIGLALMYGLLGLSFLATVQVLVYVGAIMVLFLFVIMLISLREISIESFSNNWIRVIVAGALVLAFVFQFIMITFVYQSGKGENISIDSFYHKKVESISLFGNSEVLSYALFSNYLLPFEILSIVLLIAVIGATMLAKKNNRKISE